VATERCGFGNLLTFEASSLGEEESGVLPSDGVLGVRATRLEHLVESGNAVTLLELYDILADFVDDAGDVIALVGVVVIG
jgi:hypothetical protein